MVVDTSIAAAARLHKEALGAVSSGPIRAIILTHAHGDHTGGIAAWRETGTQVIVQRQYPEFLEYTSRLGGYFARSNVAQFGGSIDGAAPAAGRGAGAAGRGAAAANASASRTES